MSQLKKGALLSYVNIFLTITIGLVLTPFIIHSLGNSEYGLYTLIGSFVAYLALMDFGLNNTIIRFVAKYRAEKDLKGEQQFLGSIFIIYFIISFVLVLIGIFLYFRLETIFGKSLSSEEIRKAKIMFQFLIFDLAIALPGGAFTAICNAYESFIMPRIISIVKYLFRGLTVFAVLTMGGKAISIVVIDTVLNVITIMIVAFFVFNQLKVKINFKGVETKLLKIIFSYSVWIFLLAIISQFQWQSGQIILGAKLGTISVAIYGVGIMLGGYYGTFSSAISGLFLPKATRMVVNNCTNEELTLMMIKIGRLSFVSLGLIFLGFLLFGQQFIFLWIGQNYENSWTIALLVMIAYTFPLIQTFANSLLEATNRIKIKGIIYLICLSFGLLLGYFLIDKYKEIGMITGVVVGWILGQIILNFYYHFKVKLNILKFIKGLFTIKLILSFLMSYIVGLLLNKLNLEISWINLGFKAIVFCAVYALINYSIVLTHEEKNIIFK